VSGDVEATTSAAATGHHLWDSVNGEWFARSTMPPGRQRIGAFADTAVRVRAEVEDMLERAAEGADCGHVTDVGVLYASLRAGMAGLPLRADGERTSALLAAADAIGDPAGWGRAAGLASAHGVPSALTAHRATEDGRSTHALTIGRPLIGTTDRGSVEAILREAVEPLLPGTLEPSAAAQVVAADAALAAARPFLAKQRRRRHASVEELSDEVETRSVLLAWAAAVGLRPDDVVAAPVAADVDRAVSLLLGVAPSAWRVWSRLAVFWNPLLIVASSLPGRLRTARGIDAAPGTPMEPLDLAGALMPWALDRLLVDTLDVGVHEEVEKMFAAIVHQFAAQVLAATWLSPEARQVTVDALTAMTVDCGPERLGAADLAARRPGPLVRDDLTDNLLALGEHRARVELEPRGAVGAAVVNAAYLPVRNTVVVPVALLRPPFYGRDWPAARRSGALGALIGHEVVHVLDPGGPVSVTARWSADEVARLARLRDQVAGRFDGLPVPGGGGPRVRGVTVAVEAFADALGVQLAWSALGPRATPTDRGEFARAWARIWRFRCTPEYLQRTLPSAHHPHPQLRCDLAIPYIDAADILPHASRPL
jgi:predicted metalloendopeptidase